MSDPNELLKKITPAELKGIVILCWELTKDNPNVHPMMQASVESIGIRTGILKIIPEGVPENTPIEVLTKQNSGIPSINGEQFSAILAEMGPDLTGYVTQESIDYDKKHGITKGLEVLEERNRKNKEVSAKLSKLRHKTKATPQYE
jgi:hypothetical protein